MAVSNQVTTEYISPSQTVVISIPNAISVQSVTTNTGIVSSYNLSGGNLTVQLNNGAVTRTAYVTGEELINFSYQYMINSIPGFTTIQAAQAYSQSQCDIINNLTFTDVYGNIDKCNAIDQYYIYIAYDYSGGSGTNYHAQWQMGRHVRRTILIPQNYYKYNLTINYTTSPVLSPVAIDRYIVECQLGLYSSYIGTSQNTWTPNTNSTWQKIYEGPNLSCVHYTYNQSVLFYRVKAVDKNGNATPYLYSTGILRTV
jgi:hypothetical protein